MLQPLTECGAPTLAHDTLARRTNGIIPGQWRYGEVYASILSGGRPALAWELLRRDPAYFAAALTNVCTAAPVNASDLQCLSRWGLHFLK